jgi:hypothetical protein
VLSDTEVACIYSRGQRGEPLPSIGPRLFLQDLTFGDWKVYWAASITGYVLESSPRLGPGAVWTEEFTTGNALSFATYDPTAPTKFFRLKKVNP